MQITFSCYHHKIETGIKWHATCAGSKSLKGLGENVTSLHVRAWHFLVYQKGISFKPVTRLDCSKKKKNTIVLITIKLTKAAT